LIFDDPTEQEDWQRPPTDLDHPAGKFAPVLLHWYFRTVTKKIPTCSKWIQISNFDKIRTVFECGPKTMQTMLHAMLVCCRRTLLLEY
jgi:hypothetical protein